MPSAHIADVMAAVRTRILELAPLFDDLAVDIGNPASFHPRQDTAPPLVTLFVYRIEPDNSAMLATPSTALALRLHVLITVYAGQGETEGEIAGSYELRILSHIIRLFHEQPHVGPVRIREAVPVGALAALVTQDLMIEARQMAPDMEEINHIWTTQADAPYRTSVVYRFSFGIVTPSQPSDEGQPVLTVDLSDPDDPDPDAHGVTPVMPTLVPEPEPEQGVLSLDVGAPGPTRLAPGVTLPVGGGAAALEVLAVTETAENLDLVLERFDQTTGTWVDETADLTLASVTSLARLALQGGGAITTDTVGFPDPGAAMVFRLGAVRPGDPDALVMAPVFVTFEAP